MKYFVITDSTDTQVGLRLAGIEGVVVREESQVRSAVEGLWREICLEELAAQTAPSDGETEETPPAAGEEPAPETQPGGETEPPAEASVEIPPCPWQIRFYPDTEYAGIVEVLLKTA